MGGAIGNTLKSTFNYGTSSSGGKTITNKMAVQRLANSGDKNKGMLLFKRVVCDLPADASTDTSACKVFKMGQCLRCSDTQYMHQELTKTKAHRRRAYQDMPSNKAVFTDQISDGNEKMAIQLQKRKETSHDVRWTCSRLTPPGTS